MRAPHALAVFSRSLALGFVVTLAAVAEIYAAQDVCAPIVNDALGGKLQRLMLAGCLGGANDQDPRVIGLRESIQSLPGREDANRLTTALDIVGKVHDNLLPNVTDTMCNQQIAQAVGAVTDALLTQQLTPKPVACPPPSGSAYQTTCWEFDTNSSLIPALPNCPLADSSVQESSVILRFSTIMRTTLDGVFAPLASEYHAEATELRGRWWAYFHETRTQFPWEVGINALSFKDKISHTKGRFHTPPNRQWIFAHPEASLEYLPKAPDGQQLKPTLTVELLGINRWKWEHEKAAKAIGFAAVVNYADVETINDWRFGAIVHVAHRYSFGATRSSGHTGYFVSADLATFIMDKKKEAKKFLSGLKATN
jgi:hypothetical protein